MYTRAQTFLEKADGIATTLTVNKGLAQLDKSEQDRLKFAREATSEADVIYAIRDMSYSYSNAAGTVIDGKDAVARSRVSSAQASIHGYP